MRRGAMASAVVPPQPPIVFQGTNRAFSGTVLSQVVPIGDPYPERVVVLSVEHEQHMTDGLTIGGQPAYIVSNAPSTSYKCLSWAWASVPDGTTTTVAFPRSYGTCTIGIWTGEVEFMAAKTPVVAQSNITLTDAVTLPEQGQVLGMSCTRQCSYRGLGGYSWTGLTEMYDLHNDAGSNGWYTTQGGAMSGLLGAGDKTVTSTFTNSIQGYGMSLAAFRRAKYDLTPSPVEYLGVAEVTDTNGGKVGIVTIPEGLPAQASALFVLTGGSNSPVTSVSIGGEQLQFLGHGTNTRNVTTGSHNFANSASSTTRQVSYWLLKTAPPPGSHVVEYVSNFNQSFCNMRVLFLNNVVGIKGSEHWQGATSSTAVTISDPPVAPLILPGAIVVYSIVKRGGGIMTPRYGNQTPVSTYNDPDGVGASHLISVSSTIPVGVTEQQGYYAAYTMVLR